MDDFAQSIFWLVIVGLCLWFLSGAADDCEKKGGVLIDGAVSVECVKLEKVK